MKQGDKVSKEVVYEAGSIIAHISSPDLATKFMNDKFPGLKYELVTEGVRILEGYRYAESADVKWVVDNEMALQYADGSYRVVTISEEPEWIVTYESAPSYQSSVANMSDEELRLSIDALRNNRLPVAKKERVAREPVDNDPMAKVLASLTSEKKLELMRKMGMVD